VVDQQAVVADNTGQHSQIASLIVLNLLTQPAKVASTTFKNIHDRCQISHKGDHLAQMSTRLRAKNPS
jgi:hypothetical protein